VGRDRRSEDVDVVALRPNKPINPLAIDELLVNRLAFPDDGRLPIITGVFPGGVVVRGGVVFPGGVPDLT